LTFTDTDGWWFQAFAIDTPAGQFAHLEARHRAHARVEDRIRCAKTHGLGRLPSRQFAINAVWVELALTAADLLAWTQTTLLADDLVTAEPATLRYRPLHVADHPRAASLVRPHQQHLALAPRARRRVPATPRPAPVDHLNTHVPNHPQRTDPKTPATAPAVSACPDPENARPNPTKIDRDQRPTDRPGLASARRELEKSVVDRTGEYSGQ
jgi:hypothetical protein